MLHCAALRLLLATQCWNAAEWTQLLLAFMLHSRPAAPYLKVHIISEHHTRA